MLNFASKAFRVSLKRFLCPPAVLELAAEDMLGKSCVGYADDVPSPLQLIKGVKDTSIGVSIFLVDSQDLIQAVSVILLLCLK
eukprot:g35055.t1